MTPLDALLADFETVPHHERVRRVIAVGETARGGDAAAALLAELRAQGGFYHRFLALMACHGSRDGAQVVAVLKSDPSALLRACARNMTVLVCDDVQIADVLAFLPARGDGIAKLLRELARRKRHAPVDAFLETLAGGDARRLVALLPYGSAPYVLKRLDAVADGLGVYDWARLARWHPDVASAALQAALDDAADTVADDTDAAPQLDARLLARINAALPILARTRPDEAARLAETASRRTSVSHLRLNRLAHTHPGVIASLILAVPNSAIEKYSSLSLVITQAAPRLPEETLLALVRARPGLFADYEAGAFYRLGMNWFGRLAPSVRRRLYEVAGNGWRGGNGVLSLSFARHLPDAALRHAEARRHLALPALASQVLLRLSYASLLPWDEAARVLEPSIRNPDADTRGTAVAALIGCARYEPAHLADALALVAARKFEQDPVRRALLGALAGLPPSRWRAEHLPALTQIILDALDASDLSPATASEAEKLTVALIRFHPAWAAETLAMLVKERGQIHIGGLGDRLSDTDVLRIAPALLPTLLSWETREREHYLLAVAQSLGRRLRAFDDFVAILERRLAATTQSYIASQILSLLAEHRPERYAVLVPALLEKDPSVFTLPLVYNYLHERRQNLLTDPFLGRQAFKGRFSTGQTRFVLPVTTGFHRWTPAQQETFEITLAAITRDQDRDTPGVLRAVSQLASLPAIAPDRLIAFAGLDNDKIAVRDAALQALARVDDGSGVPVLVVALSDARARIAIYALRGALSEMPPERALALLEAAPTNKVTVGKEVARLVGELQTPQAFAFLERLAGTDGLHRDIRVAVLRALWDYLEYPDAWPILNVAARDADPAVARGVVRVFADRLSLGAQARLLGLLGALLDHPDVQVRADTLARLADAPIPDRESALLGRLLTLAASPIPDESQAAARAVFAVYADARNAPAIGDAVRELRANRRALQTLVVALQTALATTARRAALAPLVRAVLNALDGDAVAARLRADLAITGLSWPEIPPFLSDLAARGELHADALAASLAAISGAVQTRAFAAATGAGDDETDELAQTERALAQHADEKLRRVAVAVLVARAAHGAAGWSPVLRARLETYKTDVSPLVAAAAQFTFPPPAE